MWYYAQNGKPVGPVPLEKLKELVRAGTLRPGDHILPVGTQQWKPASTLEELFPKSGPAARPTPQAAPPARPPAPVLKGSMDDPDPGPQTWSLMSPFAEPVPPQAGFPVPAKPAAGEPAQPGLWEPSFGRRLGRHFLRLLSWDLRGIAVDEDERRFLLSQGVDDPTLQRYLTWRHSLLLILVVPVLLLAILNTIDSLSGVQSSNALGKVALISILLCPFALPFTALFALIIWHRPRLSWRLLLAGWVLATFGPLLLMLLPRHAMLNFEALPGLGAEPDEAQRRALAASYGGQAFVLAMGMVLVFGLAALAGARRACLRLKTLLPPSPVPGLFLGATGPLLTLFLLPYFVLACQLAMSPLLAGAAFCLLVSPLLYTLFARRLTGPFSQERDFKFLKGLQLATVVAFWLGLVLLMAWAFVGPVPDFFHLGPASGGGGTNAYRPLLGFGAETSWLRPWDWRLFRWLIVEPLGRSLFTLALAADLVMRVSAHLWRAGRKPAPGPDTARHDQLMERLAAGSGK